MHKQNHTTAIHAFVKFPSSAENNHIGNSMLAPATANEQEHTHRLMFHISWSTCGSSWFCYIACNSYACSHIISCTSMIDIVYGVMRLASHFISIQKYILFIVLQESMM